MLPVHCQQHFLAAVPTRLCALFMAWVVIQSTALAQPYQILETHNASLTTYLPNSLGTGATSIQKIRPLASQRGVGLDGFLRASASIRTALQGNPYELNPDVNGEFAGVRLDIGTAALTEVDLALPSQGVSWIIARSYNARQHNGSSYIDSAGPQGYNWFNMAQPELVRGYTGSPDSSDDVLYLVYGADRYIEFKWVSSTSSDITFKGVNGAAGVIVVTIDNDGPDTAVYTDQQGNGLTFFWFDSSTAQVPANLQGSFWKAMAPDGNVAWIGDKSNASTAISSGYFNGSVAIAYDSADSTHTDGARRFSYGFVSGRIVSIIVQTKTGGTWSSPSGLAQIASIQYDYYGSSESHGSEGDLKMVTLTTPLSDGSSVNAVKKKYYRYYTSPAHLLKYIVDYEGTRNYDWDQDSDVTDNDFLAATDDNQKPYASAYFEYDGDRRITKTWTNGACSCGGGPDGAHAFTYQSNGSFSGTSGYDTTWHSRTVVELPGKTDAPTADPYVTQYFDELGQPLHRVLSDRNPTDTSPAPNFWVTKITRDGTGCITHVHTPENLDTSGYTHSTGAITSSTSNGLVRLYKRISGGATSGFVQHVKYRKGYSATDSDYTLEGSKFYHLVSKTLGGSGVTRALTNVMWRYSDATTTEATSSSGPAGAEKTSINYAGFHTSPGELMPATVTTSYPQVTEDRNGPGTGVTITSSQYFNADGALGFSKSEDGIITYRHYGKGQLTRLIEDADTGDGDFSGITVPSGFDGDGSGDEMHVVTDYAYTATGGTESVTQPDGLKPKVYYSKLGDGRLVTLKFPDHTTSPSFKLYGPVVYTVSNLANNAEVQGTIQTTNNESTIALSSWINENVADPITAVIASGASVAQMTVYKYDEPGTRLEETRRYFNLPGSGEGSSSNYDSTLIGYDNAGRQWRVEDATGTIERTVYDKIGRLRSKWVGTNDNDSTNFPGGETSGTPDMVKTMELEYDTGVPYDAGGQGKNSRVTKRTVYLDGSGSPATRVTIYAYDVRGNLLLQNNPDAPKFVLSKYDNQDRAIARGLYTGDGSGDVTESDNPLTRTQDRLALAQRFFDQMGRVYKRQRHKINQGTGADDDNLQGLFWYDPPGRLIKADGGQLVKYRYDRLGRPIRDFVLASDNDSQYSHVYDSTGKTTQVSDDIVLEERHVAYETGTGLFSNDVWLTAVISRFHSDYGGSQTTGPLDTVPSSTLAYVDAEIKGRIQIRAMWYDSLGRLQDVVDLGQYDADSDGDFDGYDRAAAATPPSRSDTALRTTYTYNIDGTLQQVDDPRGLKTRHEYDDLGRVVATIGNHVNGAPSGTFGDDDVYTRVVYDKGRVLKEWTDWDGDGTIDAGPPEDQVTEYFYEVRTSDSPGASKVNSNRLLRQVTYPDSGSSDDVVRLAYNAQGEPIWRRDQEGNVIELDYDGVGRITHRRVTTLDADFDGVVRRISTTFDPLGRPQLVTSWSNATPGSGTVRDEVKLTFDDWGMLQKDEQDHDSAIGGGGVGDYEVSYAYAKATSGRNTIRRTSMTLPSGNVIDYSYVSSGGLHDDAASRVTEVHDGMVKLASYQYNGLQHVVGVRVDPPGVMSNLHGSTGLYPNMDRFNRVTSSRWTRDVTTDFDFYRFDLSFDRNSNVTRVEDQVHPGFDAAFGIDGLNRLTKAQEGTWNGSSITSPTRHQTWQHPDGTGQLDQLGNWGRVKLNLNDAAETPTFDYADANEFDDTRTHNEANELTGRDTDSSGSNNFTPQYDGLGNVSNDGGTYVYVYDAFGRLRQVKRAVGSALVAEHWYNGLGARIAWKYDTDTDGDVDGVDKKYHFVYDSPGAWRVVAVYRESDASPKEEFVHHCAGLGGRGGALPLDNAILRDKDANTAWTSASDGTLEQRYYYLHNWHGDLAVILTSGSTIVEQARYSSYGVPFGLPCGDVNGDGTVNGLDYAILLGAGGSSDWRCDFNLDGVIDTTDTNTVFTNWGDTLGWNKLSLPSTFNRRGYAGYEQDGSIAVLYHVRARVFHTTFGRWIARDPLSYIDGLNLYEYTMSNPGAYVDPFGLRASFGSQASNINIDPVIGEGDDDLATPGSGPGPGGTIPAPGSCTPLNPFWPCCFPCIQFVSDGTVWCPYDCNSSGGGSLLHGPPNPYRR